MNLLFLNYLFFLFGFLWSKELIFTKRSRTVILGNILLKPILLLHLCELLRILLHLKLWRELLIELLLKLSRKKLLRLALLAKHLLTLHLQLQLSYSFFQNPYPFIHSTHFKFRWVFKVLQSIHKLRLLSIKLL